MVNFPGRNDRRRRVLKEELLSASSTRTIRADNGAADDDAPRYSEAAGVENHPQVTDFVPRRYSTIALLALAGGAFAAVSAALHYFVLPFAAGHGMVTTAAFDLAARGNLSQWLSAVVLLLASGFCVLTYSLRRHRIDDIKGRYRVWAAASLACLLLSANCVTGLHGVLAEVLTRTSGWTALRDGSVWWLIVAGLPLAWIFARVLVDVRECRLALATMVGAGVCYVVSALSYFGFGPTTDPQTQTILTATPLLLGNWLVFTTIVANARFVVLDAQGLVAVKRRKRVTHVKKTPTVTPSKLALKTAATTEIKPSSPATIDYSRHTIPTAKTPADSSRWVDGSRPERESYDFEEDEDSSGGDRKLSKSDRKRLRKLKTQGRAA